MKSNKNTRKSLFEAFNFNIDIINILSSRKDVWTVYGEKSKSIASIKENGYAIIEFVEYNDQDDWCTLIENFLNSLANRQYYGIIIPSYSAQQIDWLKSKGFNNQIRMGIFGYEIKKDKCDIYDFSNIKKINPEEISIISEMFHNQPLPIRHVINELINWYKVNPDGFLCYREKNKEVVGSIFYHKVAHDIFWIRGLSVKKHYENLEIGSKLVKRVLSVALKEKVKKLTVASAVNGFWENLSFSMLKKLTICYR